VGRRKHRAVTKAVESAPTVAPPQLHRGQLIASSILFGLWLIFLLAMALTA
jgi:hypothetical protein